MSLSKISKEYNLTANATRYSSTLTVDPNGGTWNGAADPQSFTQDAQTTLTIPAPAGAVVTATFNGNGGSSPASASGSRPFLQWNRTGENGELSSLTDEAVYTFSAANGVADVLTAEYGAVEVTFPTLERDGFRLGGWSESPTAAVPEFDVGDTVSLTENRTYYAVWATVLTDADVTLTDVCCQYDGTAKHPTVTVISGNTLLEENTDYVLSYSGNCIEIGDYTVTVTGVNGYAGEVTASYSVSELGHTPEQIPAAEPSCTEDGATEGVRCSVCGTVLTAPSPIPALGHEMTAIEAKEATCTEDGNNAYYHCSRCDKAFTDAAGENATTVEAQTIPATGHDYLWKVIPATCTEKAQVQKICDNCNTIFDIVYDENTVAVGHSGVNHVAASCMENGYNEINCTNAFVVYYYDDGALIGNDPDGELAVGVDELVCGYMEKTYIEDEPAYGEHILDGSWTTVTAPTCLAEGTESQVCSRCGETVIRETDALGHDISNVRPKTINPTCTETGLRYYLCKRCNEIAQQLVLDKQHTFRDAVSTTSPNCTEKGYTIKECVNGCVIETADLQPGDLIKLNAASVTVNGTTISTTDNIEAIYAVIESIGRNPSGEGNLYTVNFSPARHSEITATFSADEFTSPVTSSAVVPATGHQGEYTQVQERTCTQDGIYAFSSNCTECGAAISGQTLTFEHTGHTPKANSYPSCTTGVVCTVCGQNAIEPLGHDYVVPGCVLKDGASGFYCQRCGYLPASQADRTATLSGVLNLIKSPAYATKRVSSFSKSKMSTSYSKFDFGIYTSVVKDYYEKEVAAVTVDYDPLETASIFELFPLRNRSYAVKPTFTEDDVKNIKIEQLSGMNTNSILTGYDEQDPTKGASTVMPNISSFRNKTINEKIIKVTLALKNETYQKNGSNIPTGSTINSYGQKVYNEDTHTSKIFDYDIRKIVDNAGFDAGTWQISEGGSEDGYEMKMTLNYIKADTVLTYYFAADDYQPIAAVCNINETMDQDLSMKIMTIDGVIKPMITTERSYVYLFSDFFNGLA